MKHWIKWRYITVCKFIESELVSTATIVEWHDMPQCPSWPDQWKGEKHCSSHWGWPQKGMHHITLYLSAYLFSSQQQAISGQNVYTKNTLKRVPMSSYFNRINCSFVRTAIKPDSVVPFLLFTIILKRCTLQEKKTNSNIVYNGSYQVWYLVPSVSKFNILLYTSFSSILRQMAITQEWGCNWYPSSYTNVKKQIVSCLAVHSFLNFK